jgi:hypothetical protein
MEVAPLQCCPENVHLNGHLRCFLPRCSPTRLGHAPEEYHPGYSFHCARRRNPSLDPPTAHRRNARIVHTIFDREMYKLEKERFEKIDEAETTLHAAIVESLSLGTVRTINTATPSGIASLSAAQLVGLVHTLFSTPTLQDINTVNADLLRPLQNFEEFPDHITEHINHYDSLASFNQPCANISNQDTNFPGLHSTLAPIRLSHRLMGRTKPKRFEPRFPRLHHLPAYPILQLTTRCQASRRQRILYQTRKGQAPQRQRPQKRQRKR